MGWLYTHRPKGTSTREFFEKEFRKDVVIDDIAQIGFSVVYLAYHYKEVPEKVYGAVTLIHWSSRFNECNFGYKDMSEDMGPNESECPERILKLLSPVEELYTGDGLEWAKAWRDRCWANVERMKNRFKLKNGAEYRMTDTVRFNNGEILHPGDVVTCLNPRRRLFGRHGYRYRISNCYDCMERAAKETAIPQ